MTWRPPVGLVDLDLDGPSGGTALDLGGRAISGSRWGIGAGTSGGVSGAVRATLSGPAVMAGTTGGVSGRVGVSLPRPGRIAGQTAGVTGVVKMAIDPDLLSDTVGQTAAHWHAGECRHRGAHGRFRDARPTPASGRGGWSWGLGLLGPVRSDWRTAAHASGSALPRWPHGQRHDQTTVSPWNPSPRADARAISAWKLQAAPQRHGPAEHWHDLPREIRTLITRWGTGEAIRSTLRDRFGDGRQVRIDRIARWQDAALVWYVRRPPGPPTPPPPPPPQSTHLCLRWDLPGATLILGRDCQTLLKPVVIPIRRVYLVLNEVLLWRAVDTVAVPAVSLTLALDAASWAWGFTATLPAAALPLVEPTADGPVALMARVNGTTWSLLAEQVSRERQFGRGQIRLSGRGHQAVLDAPYAPVQTFANPEARSARQLMDEVLRINGVPLPWSIAWALEDWHVPAGTFSHQGTWLTALVAIAQAAGGYLRPDPQAPAFTVCHRYPTAPWEWESVTPEVILPADAVSRESLAWVAKPAYNRVFVQGQGQGVIGQVTRAGTAGDVLAPMVVDALITTAAAARQRGLAILGDTGRQLAVGLRLPVLPETGVMAPGAFVQYQDGSVQRRGLVRSVSVEVGLPEVWQTLEVETHA